MQRQSLTPKTLAAGAAIATSAAAVASARPEVDNDAVDAAFETLKSYDWGADRNAMKPIDDAIVATQGDADARKALEKRLVEALSGDSSHAAKNFICRQLRTIGTAESTSALAALLADNELSHLARYALERIPAPQAAAAMRDVLPKLSGALKIGVIGSLGVRRDADSVGPLAGLLGDGDAAVAVAAAVALGTIGNPAAGKALAAKAKNGSGGADVKLAIADGCLACAEKLLSDGKKGDALTLYKTLSGSDQPKHVQLAARRGLLAAAAKRD